MAGFGLDVAHLPLDEVPVTIDDYDASCARHGLFPVARYSTWDSAPFDAGAGYAVSVHQRSGHRTGVTSSVCVAGQPYRSVDRCSTVLPMVDSSAASATSRTALDDRPASVGRMFFDRVAATPDREAYRYPSSSAEGGWASMTWGETGDRVTKLAAGLIALGVEPEQRVAIASGTRYEWILADLAIMSAGAATTTVYPSIDLGGRRLHHR